MFCESTKVFEEALNAIKLLVLLKTFGPPQKFLGPVKGQGKSIVFLDGNKLLCLSHFIAIFDFQSAIRLEQI